MIQPENRLFVPAEDHRHERTFMQWPVDRRVHTSAAERDAVQQAVARIANTVAGFEPVVMLAAASDHAAARRHLTAGVELWDVPTQDLWCRDSGPLFAVRDGTEPVVSHIRFNGWGGKQRHTRDGQVAMRVAEHLGTELVDSGLTGEPGGVEHDGAGLLMAHESSWVNANRNPGLSREEIERRLLDTYGAGRMIWSRGLKGADITDYHIDGLARFTAPGRVLLNLPETGDDGDPFLAAARDTHDRLVAAGLDVEVIPEPVTRRVDDPDFVASYVNFHVCNGAVIAAAFGDERTDAIARDGFERHYPGREIVMLDVDALGQNGGGIHCATQQMPAL